MSASARVRTTTPRAASETQVAGGALTRRRQRIREVWADESRPSGPRPGCHSSVACRRSPAPRGTGRRLDRRRLGRRVAGSRREAKLASRPRRGALASASPITCRPPRPGRRALAGGLLRVARRGSLGRVSFRAGRVPDSLEKLASFFWRGLRRADPISGFSRPQARSGGRLRPLASAIWGRTSRSCVSRQGARGVARAQPLQSPGIQLKIAKKGSGIASVTHGRRWSWRSASAGSTARGWRSMSGTAPAALHSTPTPAGGRAVNGPGGQGARRGWIWGPCCRGRGRAGAPTPRGRGPARVKGSRRPTGRFDPQPGGQGVLREP